MTIRTATFRRIRLGQVSRSTCGVWGPLLDVVGLLERDARLTS